jgi:hypothetical protein
MDQRVEHDEEPSQMRIWNRDAKLYRERQLFMIGNKEYVDDLSNNIVLNCFGTQNVTKDNKVESVLWKRIPNLLIYWLARTLLSCLTMLRL